MGFEEQQFRPLTIADTRLETWFERDRKHVALINIHTDTTLVEWRDEDVDDAVDSGILEIGGPLRVGSVQRRLHESAFDHWRTVMRPLKRSA